MRVSKPWPIRTTQELIDLRDKMVELHGAHTVTDYVAGLIVLDAFRNLSPEKRIEWLRNVAIPSWATEVILAITEGANIQLPPVTSASEGGIRRGSKSQRNRPDEKPLGN